MVILINVSIALNMPWTFRYVLQSPTVFLFSPKCLFTTQYWSSWL